MNKWIAEFELEDGDTMPEHMDLEYKGAKIDFHCSPLVQEPFINKPCVSSGVCEHDKKVVIDKVYAEIVELQRAMLYASKVEFKDIYKILDKYKAETEAEDGTDD